MEKFLFDDSTFFHRNSRQNPGEHRFYQINTVSHKRTLAEENYANLMKFIPLSWSFSKKKKKFKQIYVPDGNAKSTHYLDCVSDVIQLTIDAEKMPKLEEKCNEYSKL